MAFPSTFKPDQGGNSGTYTLANLQSGDSVKVRVMSDFITGLSVWGEDSEGNRVCTRVRDGEVMPTSAIGINQFSGQPERVKQFIAAVVYNHDTQSFEVLETDKATIIEQLFELESNPDWGDLKEYDIRLSKTGQKMETKYTVSPSPAKKLDKTILDAYSESQIDLEALYRGDSPFTTEERTDSDDVADDVPF